MRTMSSRAPGSLDQATLSVDHSCSPASGCLWDVSAVEADAVPLAVLEAHSHRAACGCAGRLAGLLERSRHDEVDAQHFGGVLLGGGRGSGELVGVLGVALQVQREGAPLGFAVGAGGVVGEVEPVDPRATAGGAAALVGPGHG